MRELSGNCSFRGKCLKGSHCLEKSSLVRDHAAVQFLVGKNEFEFEVAFGAPACRRHDKELLGRDCWREERAHLARVGLSAKDGLAGLDA